MRERQLARGSFRKKEKYRKNSNVLGGVEMPLLVVPSVFFFFYLSR